MKQVSQNEGKRQSERFKEAARELGCDEDEAAFDAKLKKVAGHKPSDLPKSQPVAKNEKRKGQ